MISVFYDHVKEAAIQTNKSIDEIFDLMKHAGYEAIDIRSTELVGKEEEMKTLLEKHGLRISCIYEWFDFGTNGNPSGGYELIDLANRFQTTKVLIIPGFIQIKWKFVRRMTMKNMAETLKKLVAYGKEKQVQITLEDFDDFTAPYSSYKELQWFLQQVPGLKITFDTGNFLYQEEDVQEAFSVLKNDIVHVHLKDRSLIEVDGEQYKSTLKGRKMYSSAVGSGVIPMTSILESLKKEGYQGDYTVEHFGSLNQLESMLKSVEYLKSNL